MMMFLLFAPASTKWLGWRKHRKSQRDRLGRLCDIYCGVILHSKILSGNTSVFWSITFKTTAPKNVTDNTLWFKINYSRNWECFDQSCVNLLCQSSTETVHGTLGVLYLFHLLYGICVKIFITNRYISKSYTTNKNTIDRQYSERGQLQCQLLLVKLHCIKLVSILCS